MNEQPECICFGPVLKETGRHRAACPYYNVHIEALAEYEGPKLKYAQDRFQQYSGPVGAAFKAALEHDRRLRQRRTAQEQAEIDAAVTERYEDAARAEGLRRKGLT